VEGREVAQVAELTEKVIKLDAFDYPQAHFMNALSNYYLKNMEQAEERARGRPARHAQAIQRRCGCWA
jgi:hypothetical protein